MHPSLSRFGGGTRVLGFFAGLSVAGFALTAALMAFLPQGAAEDDGDDHDDSRPGLSLQGGPTAGGRQYWNAIGASGAIDEADLGIVKLSGPAASIAKSANFPATLNIRYPVYVNENFTGAEINDIIGGYYIDNGPDAQVTLTLKEFDMLDGTVTTLMEFDSDDFPQSAGGQVQYELPGSGVTYDFNFNVYWVDAAITRRSAQGKASLSGVFAGQY